MQVKRRRYMKRSEDSEQERVIDWADWNIHKFPELAWLYHVPNGGSRNKLEAQKLKQIGVKAGVSDLCLPYANGIYTGLYIEMKFGKNKRTEKQENFMEEMAKAGHYVATCYSADTAIQVLTEYLTIKRTYETLKAENVAQYVTMSEWGPVFWLNDKCENVTKDWMLTAMSKPNDSIWKDDDSDGPAIK